MGIWVVTSTVSNTAAGKDKVQLRSFKIGLYPPVWVYECSPVAHISLVGICEVGCFLSMGPQVLLGMPFAIRDIT